MKKISKQQIEKLVNYKKLTGDSVLSAFVLNFFAVAIIMILSNDYIKTLLMLTPFLIVASIIFLAFKILKRNEPKIFNLFCSLEFLVLSLVCHFSSIVTFSGVNSDKLKIIILLIVIDLVVIILTIRVMIKFLRNDSSIKNTSISVSIVSMGSIIGILIARKMDTIKLLVIVFALASSLLIFCAVAFLMIFHFFNILEKMNSGDEAKSIGDIPTV